MSPTSSTRSIDATPRVSSVGTASATIEANGAIRVCASTAKSTRALSPTNRDAGSISDGCVIRSSALASEVDPAASAPARTGSWPRMMFAATPVRKPVITETETKRV
jgi:hypothetical protein